MKNFIRTFLLSPLLLAFVATEASPKDEIDKLCGPMGGYEEKVCEVSMHRILSDPESFDRRIVKVTGFFADGVVPLLFVGRDAYEVSNTVDSVQLKNISTEAKNSLLKSNRSFVVVVGRYSAIDRVMREAESGSPISGSLAVDSAGPAVGPWGYQEPPSYLMKDGSKERKANQ